MAMKNQYDEADKEIPHIALALNPGSGCRRNGLSRTYDDRGKRKGGEEAGRYEECVQDS